MTKYMFDEGRRSSVVVWRLGYDTRAIPGWTSTAWVLVLTRYLMDAGTEPYQLSLRVQ